MTNSEIIEYRKKIHRERLGRIKEGFPGTWFLWSFFSFGLRASSVECTLPTLSGS